MSNDHVTPLTRRAFNGWLAALAATAATPTAGTAQPAPVAPGGDADAGQRAAAEARRDADSLRTLPLDGVPPAFTPQT